MFKNILIILGFSFLISSPVFAEDTKPTAPSVQVSFGTGSFDHTDFDLILQGMVMERETIIALVESIEPQVGTRIRPSNQIGRGYDINYIPYSIITEKFQIYITANKQYIWNLRTINPASLHNTEQLAYWLNLRNALVLDLIFENYPIAPKEMKELVLGAAWKTPRAAVNGTPFSIADIENLIVKTWPDPRVLYGFFYGTHNSPFIMNQAFTGDNVLQLLEANARSYLNSSATLKISKKTLKVPAVFEWHKAVYNNDPAILLNHFSSYLDAGKKKKLDKYAPQTLAFKSNWKINDIPKQIVSTGGNKLFVFGFGNGCGAGGVQTGEGCNAGVVIEDSPLANRFTGSRR